MSGFSVERWACILFSTQAWGKHGNVIQGEETHLFKESKESPKVWETWSANYWGASEFEICQCFFFFFFFVIHAVFWDHLPLLMSRAWRDISILAKSPSRLMLPSAPRYAPAELEPVGQKEMRWQHLSVKRHQRELSWHKKCLQWACLATKQTPVNTFELPRISIWRWSNTNCFSFARDFSKFITTQSRSHYLVELLQIFCNRSDLLFLSHCSEVFSAEKKSSRFQPFWQNFPDWRVNLDINLGCTHFFIMRLWKLCVVRSWKVRSFISSLMCKACKEMKFVCFVLVFFSLRLTNKTAVTMDRNWAEDFWHARFWEIFPAHLWRGLSCDGRVSPLCRWWSCGWSPAPAQCASPPQTCR